MVLCVEAAQACEEAVHIIFVPVLDTTTNQHALMVCFCRLQEDSGPQADAACALQHHGS
jgi:hypothetical protein